MNLSLYKDAFRNFAIRIDCGGLFDDVTPLGWYETG
jgi:hypothetical protein